MRIGIAMPVVPFVRGGSELLSATLAAELRTRGHQVDAITLPYKWYPPERLLLDSLAWRQFDFTEADGAPVDLLICTKFPSYLALHPNKVVWLYHQFRQAYDQFGARDGALQFDDSGTATRDALVALDRLGLESCRRRFAISRNVADRLQRYNDLTAQVLYPPPRGDRQFKPGPYGDYLLYVGRLDRMKRVELLLEAAARMKQGRVILCGEGPERPQLAARIAELGLSNRVNLAGFVPDETLYELYAGARAVYYAPVDEDYGFATVEAMRCAKPVLTCHDSGGVLEFVSDGETGLIAAPEADALAAAADRLFSDAALARRLGEAGRERVRPIAWGPVLDALLEGAG